MAPKILIKNGRVLDPASNTDAMLDVLAENSVIQALGHFTPADHPGALVLEAAGCWVVPGLIDLHVHLREPGQTYKETIVSGTQAAAAGGFTTVCCMPNTEPYADSPEVIQFIKEKAASVNTAHVLPVAGITLGQRGETLSPMAELAAAGACAFSEDGRTVADTTLMKEALRQAATLDLPVLSHCEDASASGGAVHAGIAAKKFNLQGITGDSETNIVKRDIALAREIGAHLHICHVSAAGSVALLRETAGDDKITAECCPHHFAFCDEDIITDDGRYKMNPPLRARSDKEALLMGLQDGTIPVIATDHAPHSAEEKAKGLRASSFGVVGLETAVSAGITYLVNAGIMSPMRFIAAMTIKPARVLKINKGTMAHGAAADITVIDPNSVYTTDTNTFLSKGRSTPFAGLRLTGTVRYTILNGRIIHKI